MSHRQRVPGKLRRHFASAALADFLRDITNAILLDAAAHSRDGHEMQSVAMTSLTSIVFGVIGELSGGNADSMQALMEAHDAVLVGVLADWRAELLRQGRETSQA